MSSEELRLVVQLALGLVFLASTLGKLRRPRAFARGVAEYKLLPPLVAYAFGFALIPLEGYLAISHLSGWTLRIAAPVAMMTLAAFTVAVGVNLARKRKLPCFCFGDGEALISRRSLVRLFLLLAAEALLLFDRRLFLASSDEPLLLARVVRAADLATALLLASGLLVGGLWLLAAPELIRVLRGSGCGNCRRPSSPRSAS